MVKFLEKNHYQVDYASDTDINNNPQLLLAYKAIIITGHDEYWTHVMLDAYYAAVSRGVNLAVFAANTGYRPTRFESDPITKLPNRIIVCYKDYRLDPYSTIDPSQLTGGNWRHFPFNKPESQLLGEVYKDEILHINQSGDLVVKDSKNWIFAGSGLRIGSAIRGIVGYEYDDFVPEAPHPINTTVVFTAHVKSVEGQEDEASSSLYQLHGQVFDAGTIEWSWGLDPNLKTYSPGLTVVTNNILKKFN